MREFHTQPHEVLVIGDSDIDVLTGRNVGAWTCGVRYGFDPSRLEKAPPDILVDCPQELPQIFLPASQSAVDTDTFRDMLA
jgi:phosphoglycolate phosphatase-like HAD superfamily hydrolase